MFKLTIFILIQFLVIYYLIRNVHVSKKKTGRSVSDCDDIECNQIEEYPDSSVVFSAVIFRHGDRAPELPEVYANDPYKSEERYWPGGFGNLLKRGRQREYTLGKFLRHRYSMLLPETYYYHDINVTSSDLDRTITSALCVLAGLYLPQAYDHDMDSDIVAPVIPVHAINMNNDMYIMFKKNCPRYAKELDSARELKYNETLSQGMGPVYDYLTKYTGQTIDCITDVNRIHTALLIQREQGYPAPAWTQGPQYPLQQIEYIGGLSFYVRANSKVQQRLAGGPLVTKIIDAMLNKRNGSLSPDYKMMLFSGHDTTVSIILHTLGYDKPDFVFCSQVTIHHPAHTRLHDALPISDTKGTINLVLFISICFALSCFCSVFGLFACSSRFFFFFFIVFFFCKNKFSVEEMQKWA
uniref:acid phosphatase n=1 Tax=Cacopsylla melanoneura TaxID=428564 RepID=A0A8D8TWK9_9HEMI